MTASSGTVWYFAEGFTGGGANNNQWQTYLYLVNVTSAPAAVTITYFQSTGGTTVKNIVIPPESRRTMFANDPAEGPGDGVAFGIKITSDQPVTADQSLVDTVGELAHGSAGSQVLSDTWYFAEGFTGNGWLTFISATNPGATAANVALTYHLTDGTAITRTAVVAPGSRFTFAAHEDPNNPATPGEPTGVGLGQAFAVSILSDQPIVSQEVLIDTVGLLAHGTIGVTSLDTTWYFAEGVTTNQWLTFISVGNLSGSTATVTATYNILGQLPESRTITLAPGARGTFAAQDDPLAPGDYRRRAGPGVRGDRHIGRADRRPGGADRPETGRCARARGDGRALTEHELHVRRWDERSRLAHVHFGHEPRGGACHRDGDLLFRGRRSPGHAHRHARRQQPDHLRQF